MSSTLNSLSAGCPHPAEGVTDPAAADSSSTAAAERTQTPGEYVGEAESRESDRKWRHRLSQIDPERRVAICAQCGETRVRPRGRTGWRCVTGERGRTRNRRASNRKYDLKFKFGLSLADYDALLLTQGGVCAICQQPCPTRRNLAVDHDHETGRVRGLLCNQCNRALGLLRDDTARLSRAISYLSR